LVRAAFLLATLSEAVTFNALDFVLIY